MKNFLTLFTVCAFLVTVSCSNKSEAVESPSPISTPTSYVDISVDEFHNLASAPESDIIILDVRTSREFDGGNIPNSLNIDFRSPDFATQISELDTSKTYVVYCQVGGRSSAASKLMHSELGFNDVRNLKGGYATWNK